MFKTRLLSGIVLVVVLIVTVGYEGIVSGGRSTEPGAGDGGISGGAFLL